MYKRTIKYVDYDGNERSEDHYFNLSNAEVMQLLMTTGDYTFDKVIERLYEENNNKELFKIFSDLIYMSYGKKSLDGRRFDKSEEAKRDFMETEAYSVLFTELATDAKSAAEFINGIIPKDLAEKVAKIMADNPEGIPDALKDYAQVGLLPLA